MQVETIFCDFVRSESNGKHLLIGVYASDVMFVPHIPGIIAISAYSRVTGLIAGLHTVDASFYSPHDTVNPVSVINSTINIAYPELPTPVITGPIQIQLQDIGYVTLRLRIKMSNGQIIDEPAGKLFVGRSTPDHAS